MDARGVGGWEPTLLEVGVLRMPGTDMAPEGVLDEVVDVPTNVLLLCRAGTIVLVDAGPGVLDAWLPSAGPGLETSLGGMQPDLLVLTHLDFDHVGGALAGTWPDDLRPAFPLAPVVLLGEAAAVARARDPDRPWNSGTYAVRTFDREGVLREVADGEQFAPGLRLRAAPGHRSGHAVLEVGQSLLHLADVIHDPLHVEHPDWDGQHDGKRELALATRIALLEEAAERRVLCVASHVRGAGRIEREGGALCWTRAPL
jgi:glyoxylase-like metal-dependent hydrolase (beta-lactamase superfamily II)